MNAIEKLMDALWNASEDGKSCANAQWAFSAEFYAELKAAVRPGLDPFGAERDNCLGLPYVVRGWGKEPFILEGLK